MRRLIGVVVLGFAFAGSAQAQRVGDARTGVGPLHQDSTRRPAREAMFAQRAMLALPLGFAAAAPFAVIGALKDSESMLLTGGVVYLATASYVAASVRSRECDKQARMLLAFGGALAGAVAGTYLAEQAFQPAPGTDTNRARPITLTTALLGVPLGAAAALYNCN